MMGGTLIIVRGSAGVGKTAALQAVEQGQEHLLCGLLAEAAREAMPCVWHHEDVACSASDLLSLLEDQLDEHAVVVVDPDMLEIPIVEGLADKYRVVRYYLVAAPWLVEARRKARRRKYQAFTPDGCLPDADEIPLAAHIEYDLPFEQVFVDASDWPLREVTQAEAEAIVSCEAECEVILDDLDAQYQRCLKISGAWHGDPTPERKLFEQARLDAILPADCAGMVVLDVGAAEGGFCFEALQRGAIMAVALDGSEERLGVVRRVRTAARQPVTACHCDVVNESLPLYTMNRETRRYDLGLLLNVLHHCDDPLTVFEKVLAACDRVVVETPYGIGAVPHKPGLEPYPNAWHLPPYWVRQVGLNNGFRLKEIRMGPMHPTQRLIFDLERYYGS